MGARPSSFKKGGGFLNGVDGVITDYTFTDEFNGDPFKPGQDPKTKKEKFHTLYCNLSVRVDGADEDVTTNLFVGDADAFDFEDGKTLTPNEEGTELGANTSFAKLISSLCEAGFPETSLPEDSINYESIIGTRVRLVQRRNDEDTKRLGKRKGKDGKQYDRTDLVVDQVYDLPNGSSTAAAPAKAAKGGKPSAAPKGAKAAPVVDLSEQAAEVLTSILAANDGSIKKSVLSTKILQKIMKDPNREAIRTLILSDEFLTGGEGWTYDGKKGVIAAVEAE